MSSSQALGKTILQTEVSNISSHGIWLLTQDKELFIELIFKFLDDPETVPGNFYKFVKDLGNNLDEVKEVIDDEFDVPETKPALKKQEDKSLDLLKPKVRTTLPKSTQANKARIDFVRTGDEAENLREKVVDAVILSKKRKKEKKTKKAFINNLRKSYTFLLDAKNLYSEDSIKEGAIKYIENIETIIDKIKGKLG